VPCTGRASAPNPERPAPGGVHCQGAANPNARRTDSLAQPQNTYRLKCAANATPAARRATTRRSARSNATTAPLDAGAGPEVSATTPAPPAPLACPMLLAAASASASATSAATPASSCWMRLAAPSWWRRTQRLAACRGTQHERGAQKPDCVAGRMHGALEPHCRTTAHATQQG
jgi:hypothetical protein